MCSRQKMWIATERCHWIGIVTDFLLPYNGSYLISFKSNLECCTGQVMPIPLPPIWVPLASHFHTFASRSHPSPAGRGNAVTPWLVKFYHTRCWQVSALWWVVYWNTSLASRCTWSVSVSSLWDGESGKWQSGNSGGTIDTSDCSLSIMHVAGTRRWCGSSRDKCQCQCQ